MYHIMYQQNYLLKKLKLLEIKKLYLKKKKKGPGWWSPVSGKTGRPFLVFPIGDPVLFLRSDFFASAWDAGATHSL